MPRRARLDAPGTLHHVIIRGIEKKDIVSDNTEERKARPKKDFKKFQVSGVIAVCRVRFRIAIMLFTEYGIPIAEIARNTGVSTSAVSKIVNKSNNK